MKKINVKNENQARLLNRQKLQSEVKTEAGVSLHG